MFPLVKINAGAVSSKTITKVEVQHAINSKDMAVIQMNMLAGGGSYAAKQPVQIAMASGGPALFDGHIRSVDPVYVKGIASAARIVCLGAARAHAQESTADTTFLDSPTNLTLHVSPLKKDHPPAEMNLWIRNSRETTSLMYELNMMKKIGMEGNDDRGILKDGYFVGYITAVDRTYTRESDRHEVHLELRNEKPVNLEPRNPNVILPRGKQSS